MKNKVQAGQLLNYTNGGSASIPSGGLVIVGALAGVAVTEIPVTETGVIDLKGVFTLPKEASKTFAQGVKVYWNATNGSCTPTATDNTLIGVAAKAAVSADVLMDVLLTNAN